MRNEKIFLELLYIKYNTIQLYFKLLENNSALENDFITSWNILSIRQFTRYSVTRLCDYTIPRSVGCSRAARTAAIKDLSTTHA